MTTGREATGATTWPAIALMGLYTVAMLAGAFLFPLEKVRYFFTDLVGPGDLSHLVFYGVNTSLAVFLEWGTALLFAVRLFLLGDKSDPLPARLFFAGQILFFVYLGADDRFLLHERLEEVYGIDDFFVLGALGVAELALLGTWGRDEARRRPASISLILAGLFFGLMLIIDKFGGAASPVRLAVEDLCKVWSAFFLLRFAWLVCRRRVRELTGRA